MNCRRRGTPAASSKQVNKPPAKTGDEQSYSDTHGMERLKIEKNPDWKGSDRVTGSTK